MNQFQGVPGPSQDDFNTLSEQMAKLNSNKSTLKLWVGTLTFTFSNTNYASVSISNETGSVVTSSNIQGFTGLGVGKALHYGSSADKTTLYAFADENINTSVSVLCVFFYS